MYELVTQDLVTMTSLEVVDLINKFRLEEGNRKELRHDNFIASIRKEIETLENVGISTNLNFQLCSYKADDNSREYKCYKLTKQGTMQMLNKESAVVRYKTQQYIEALEERLTTQRPSYMIEDPIKRAEKWIEEQKLMLELKEQNEEMKPKAEAHDNFVEAGGSFAFRELVGELNSIGLNVKEYQVRDFLKAENIIYGQKKVDSNGKEYRKSKLREEAIRDGYGVLKDKTIDGVNRPQVRFTDKCRQLCIDHFRKEGE